MTSPRIRCFYLQVCCMASVIQWIKITSGREDKTLLCCMSTISPQSLWSLHFSRVDQQYTGVKSWAHHLEWPTLRCKSELNPIVRGTKKCQRTCISFGVPWKLKLHFRPLENLELFKYSSFLTRHWNQSAVLIISQG